MEKHDSKTECIMRKWGSMTASSVHYVHQDGLLLYCTSCEPQPSLWHASTAAAQPRYAPVLALSARTNTLTPS